MTTRNLLARTRGLLRERWEASDWSRMTRRDIAWHVGGWAISLACAVFLACAYVGFVCLQPVIGWRTTAAVIFSVLLVFVTRWCLGREADALREHLHYAAVHYDVTTNSYAADLLADVGPITGETPAVEMFDQDAAEVPA